MPSSVRKSWVRVSTPSISSWSDTSAPTSFSGGSPGKGGFGRLKQPSDSVTSAGTTWDRYFTSWTMPTLAVRRAERAGTSATAAAGASATETMKFSMA